MSVVVIHHLDQARAALAAAAEIGCAIELRSAPGAAGYAGVGYLKALGDEVGHELLIDCGDDAGLVMAALRTGCRRVAFSGSAELGRPLADMAEHSGATLVVEAQAPEVVVLQPEDDAAAGLQARLNDRGRPDRGAAERRRVAAAPARGAPRRGPRIQVPST